MPVRTRGNSILLARAESSNDYPCNRFIMGFISQIRKATTVICMATMLHTIATGNMTPSYRVLPDGTVRQVYFYCVDISEFTVNKLTDRGSLAAHGIVTNVQDFIVNISKGLGL